MALTPEQWDEYIIASKGHLLQSWAWGELKSHFGWTPWRVQIDGAAAQILFRSLPLGLTIAYIPKGPVINWIDRQQCQAFFSAIHTEAKKRRAIFLKIEPNVWVMENSAISPAQYNRLATKHYHKEAEGRMREAGFTPANAIQPCTTLVVDINAADEHILAAMKQKTRYNIRLAQKKGVTVRQGDLGDISTFYELALATTARSGFDVHSLSYYQIAHRLFSPDRCTLLIAEIEGKPLAALMAFCNGEDAFYFYGASSNEQRNLMAPYLIQWAAIRWAKSRGCLRYDLWGVPDANVATLETEFRHRQNGLWGVYRFKRGFGGNVVQSVGAYDYVYNPPLYQGYKLYRKLTG